MIIPGFSCIYLTCPSLCFYESGRTNQRDKSILTFKYSWIFELFNNISLWEGLVVLKRTMLLFCGTAFYTLSPWTLCTNWISFGIMVTHLACMAHKFVSSNSKIRYASAASCNAVTAAGNILSSCPPCHRSCTNSLTRRSNGALLISSSVDHWYLLISHSATVPGLYLLGFGASVLSSLPPLHLASALATASLLASFLDSDGAPNALFLAVCFVLAMLTLCASMIE